MKKTGVMHTPASAGSRAELLARQGYLVIDRITDDADVANIRDICRALFETGAGFEEGEQFDMAGPEEDGGAPKLPQILGPRRYAPELMRTRFFEEALSIARELLGPTARLSFDHVIQKPAYDGSATPWHQDVAFRKPTHDYREVSFWLALQPVDDQNGCMEFIPGSNRGEVLPHRSPNGDVRIHALECYSGFDPATKIRCPVPAGGCTVHTGFTLHQAGPNRTSEPRFAYILIFETPPVPRPNPHNFPWQSEKRAARLERKRRWIRRGGLLIHHWWRKLRRT